MRIPAYITFVAGEQRRRRTFAPSSTIVAMALPLLLLTPPLSASLFFWNSNGQPTPHDWSNSINWAGPVGEVPGGSDDSATVNNSGVYYPVLDSNYVIGGLTLQLAGVLWTGEGSGPGDANYRLAVSSVGGGPGLTLVKDPGSRLDVLRSSNMNDFDTDDLLIQNGGRVRLLNGGIIQVDDHLDIRSGGVLEGEGAVEFTRDDGTHDPRNDGLIRAVGGEMRFFGHPDSVFDLDGTGEAGVLEVQDNATLVFDMSVQTGFAGAASIGSGSELEINAGWGLSAGATLDFDGGSGTGRAKLSGTSTTFNGDVFVNSGEALLAVQVAFGGNVTFADDAVMSLDVGGYIDQDAMFTGDGSLHVEEGVLLEVANGAHVDVPVHSDGLIVLDGEVTNVASFSTLTLGPTAQCRFGICESGPGDAADQIQVTGTATLDGELELVQIANCDPDPGDAFEIITAASVTGEFTQVTGIPNAEIIYGATSVTVRIAGPCAADMDGDDAVGFNDLTILLGNWGACGGATCPVDLDGDDTVGFNDLTILLGNWGACG